VNDVLVGAEDGNGHEGHEGRRSGDVCQIKRCSMVGPIGEPLEDIRCRQREKRDVIELTQKRAVEKAI